MSKINDRWSALSMKDRAALIDIYVKSGITDLGEIRKDYNSFDEGGDIESIVYKEGIEDDVPNYNNIYTLSRDTGDYMKNWYSQRQNIGLNSFYNKVVDEYNTKYENDLIIPKVKAPVGTNNKVGEYVVAPGSNGIVTKNPFYYEKDLEVAKDYLKDFNRRSGNFKVRFDNTSRYAGRYDPNEGNLIHISTKVPNDARLNYAVHEATHSLTNRDFNFDSDYLGHLPEDNTYYFGNPSEQYARLMQLRNYLNLDPNKVYTEDEVNKIRDDIEFKYPNTREHLGDNLLFIYSNKEIADMLNNSFDYGGYTEPNEQESKKWVSDWLASRTQQMSSNIEDYKNQYYRGSSASRNKVSPNKILSSIIEDYKVDNAKKIIDLQLDQMNSANFVDLRIPGEYEKYKNSPNMKNFLNQSSNVKGSYFKHQFGSEYPSEIIISPLADNGTEVHELTHALTNDYQIQEATIDKIFSKYGENSIFPEKAKTYKNPYLDNAEEIYSRLMQFRNSNNINPKEIITKEHLKKWRNNKSIDYNLLNRYSDDILLELFNNVAHNNIDSNRLDYVNPDNIAAFGGKLNKFETGGPIEPIYYDDTYIEPAVVKAFKSQEEYNRYLGEKGAKIVREGTNKVAQNIFKGLEYTPIISDGIDLANAVAATQKGNFKKAGVIAGAALLPNIVEKPVKAISKGVRNLNTYRKYVKDTERFRNSVNFALKGYEKNYDVLQRNVPNKLNSIEEAKFTSSFTPISTKPNLFKMRVGGHYDLGKQEVWLNAYNPSFLKDAIKSPKKAIRRLQGVATHEGNHMALDHLNDVTTIRGKKYFDPIVTHPMNAATSHIFNNPNRKVKKWQRVPEEFVSEMNYVRNGTGNAPGSSIYSFKDSHIKRAEKYLSNRFKLTPEETREAINSLEALGYSNGGYLNNDYELPLLLDTYNNYVENSKTTVVPEAPIDNNEIRRRQAWAESSGNDRNISSAGAKGRYQIMPATLKEYQDTTGDIGDIFNPVYNRKVRDYEFNRYVNSETLNMGNPTDSVKMGRRLAAYNYGLTNTRRAIHKADSLGLERNNSFEWLEALPKETKDYINFILRNKDVGGNKTDYAYKNRKN